MSKYQENVGPSDGLNPKNAALLLIDHQVGLMQLIRDMTPEEYKSNVVGLAKTAKNFGLPVILTTSMDWGAERPNSSGIKDIVPRRKGHSPSWGHQRLALASIQGGGRYHRQKEAHNRRDQRFHMLAAPVTRCSS